MLTKEKIIELVETGELSVSQLVDSYMIAQQRSYSIYHELDRLEKANQKLGDYLETVRRMGDDAFRETARVMDFSRTILSFENDEVWGAILRYIQDELERNRRLFGTGSNKYFDIDDLYSIDDPTRLNGRILSLMKGLGNDK